MNSKEIITTSNTTKLDQDKDREYRKHNKEVAKKAKEEHKNNIKYNRWRVLFSENIYNPINRFTLEKIPLLNPKK